VHINIVRLFRTLNICVLKIFAQSTEVDIKKLCDADWMSVKLKKEIVTFIKSMFRWIIKNQNVRDHKNETSTSIQIKKSHFYESVIENSIYEK